MIHHSADMERLHAEFIRRSQAILGMAALGASMALAGCSGKSPKLDDDSSSGDEDSSSEDKNKKSGESTGSASGASSGSGGKGTGSSEKSADPTSLEAEIVFEGEIKVEGKLSFTLDAEMGLAEQGGKIGDNLFNTELKLTNGKMKVSISPPGKDFDFGKSEEGDKFAGLLNLLGTVYDDVNKNGAYDKGERVIGTLPTTLNYAKPGNAAGQKEWQIVENGKPADIKGPLKVVRLDTIKAVKTLDLGGKIASLGVDVSHLSSLTFDEVEDLKKNFNATGRPIGLKLDKSKASWTSKLAEGLDKSRRRKGGYPMLPGFKNPGVEFPVGFLESAQNGGELKQDTKFSHLCISEMGGKRFTTVMLVWIEPGPDWVAERQGAIIATHYQLNPGWNILGVYVTFGNDFAYFPLNDGQSKELVTSDKCFLRLKDAEDAEKEGGSGTGATSSTGETSSAGATSTAGTSTDSSTSMSRHSGPYPSTSRFRRFPLR